MSSYTAIDNSSLPGFLFYPRKHFTPCPPKAFDLFIAVDKGVSISCRCYAGGKDWPWFIYFHGNGEVVSDYDQIAPFYEQKGINLAVVDYRGYGASGGVPTFGNLLQDAHHLFEGIKEQLSRRGFAQDFWVMGRSLGSIPALELAFHYPGAWNGFIIESGFTCVSDLIKHLRLPAKGIDLAVLEKECRDKVAGITIPALVIHGERDQIVPLAQGRELYQNLGSEQKELILIPHADHNNIMFAGFKQYFDAIHDFIQKKGPKDIM